MQIIRRYLKQGTYFQPIDGKLEKYLMTFGYLPQSDLETGAQRTELQMRNAIKNLQVRAFASLSFTLRHSASV